MNSSSRIRARSLGQHTQVELRRRVRKGTQSCWECKRRKIRCHFAAPIADPVCDGCKRHKTKCVSQEFPDDSPRTNGKSQPPDRLSRLEAIVDRLVRRIDTVVEPEDGLTSLLSSVRDEHGETQRSPRVVQGSSASKDVPFFVSDLIANPINSPVHDSDDHHRLEPSLVHNALSSVPSVDMLLARELSFRDASSYGSFSRLLLEAWPSHRELKIINDLPGETLGLFHGSICAPISTIQKTVDIREFIQLPHSGSHPVLIARKLLMLASYLQSLSPTCVRSLDQAGVSHSKLMSSTVAMAHSYVTCNESLLGSMEGIECMMIESMYHNNAGDLRLAWHSVQRAMLIAQVMGLHQSIIPQSLNFLDLETRRRFHPEFVWFRLMQMNRYLSLMLGLLQGTSFSSFADRQVPGDCTDRMQRLDCVAAGYILQRSEEGLYDASTTNMIDKLLQSSEAAQPPSWWLVPDLEATAGKGMEAFRKIVRSKDQMAHLHLVTQLHLPHLVRPPAAGGYEYSTMRALNASREVLLRFTCFSKVHEFMSFCRGVDFLAFIACTTMTIIYVDARSQRSGGINHSSGFLDLLTNQHQKDRHLMDLTLESMRCLAHTSNDLIAPKIADILSHLLSMEADTTVCRTFVDNTATEKAERDLGCGGKLSDDGQALQIYVPHIETVRFERDNGPGFVSTERLLFEAELPTVPDVQFYPTYLLSSVDFS